MADDAEVLRARILEAFDVTEDDLADLEPLTAASEVARRQQEFFRDVVLPTRIAAVERDLSAVLPAGLEVRFDVLDGE